MNSRYWIVSIIFVLLTCESDDICPESTQTTPRIVITFYDINNPNEKKNVESLGIYTVNNGQINIIEGFDGVNTCLLYTSDAADE